MLSDNWNTAGNWQNNMPPVPGWSVILKWTQGVTQKSPWIPAGTKVSLEDITLDSTFAGKELKIDGTLELGWNLGQTPWNQPVDIKGTGTLCIVEGELIWTKGSIEVSKVYVYGNSLITVTGDASNLKTTSIHLGEKPGGFAQGEAKKGTISLYAMNGNLNLKNDTTIYVRPDGLMKFEQLRNSSTAGGINQSGSLIENEGKIYRKTIDVADEVLYVGIPILNKGDNALLEIGKWCSLRIDDAAGAASSFTQTKGVLQMGPETRLEVADRLRVQGGTFAMTSDQPSKTSSLMGIVEISGGLWTIGSGENYLKVEILGTLAIKEKARLSMHVNAAVVNSGDWIDVSGAFSLTQGPTDSTILSIVRNNRDLQLSFRRFLIAANYCRHYSYSDFFQ